MPGTREEVWGRPEEGQELVPLASFAGPASREYIFARGSAAQSSEEEAVAARGRDIFPDVGKMFRQAHPLSADTLQCSAPAQRRTRSRAQQTRCQARSRALYNKVFAAHVFWPRQPLTRCRFYSCKRRRAQLSPPGASSAESRSGWRRGRRQLSTLPRST